MNGHCDGEPKKVLAPIRLHWKIPEQCISVIESSYNIARELADSVDLVVKRFESFGKRIPKLFGLSPDSFVQMALQLAYFMEKKRFCLTYESSMVRMFREGRTDTVRSCSSASCEFVQGFLDPSLPVESKRNLLKTACDQHQHLYRDAMVGKGVDRHLFALYVVSKFLKSDSPFLNEVLGEPWRLSTSQTPIHQCQHLYYPANHPAITATPGGGFGPVTVDGYGVSYIFAGEDHIFFHVSSYRTSEETDSEAFVNRIFSVLRSLRLLNEPESNTQVVTEKAS
ncbi:Carnitine O-palmitoyltransferase 1, liver isoform [Sparganum proliferum]